MSPTVTAVAITLELQTIRSRTPTDEARRRRRIANICAQHQDKTRLRKEQNRAVLEAAEWRQKEDQRARAAEASQVAAEAAAAAAATPAAAEEEAAVARVDAAKRKLRDVQADIRANNFIGEHDLGEAVEQVLGLPNKQRVAEDVLAGVVDCMKRGDIYYTWDDGFVVRVS